MTTNLIYEAVKTALKDGEAKVNLREASALTASGSNVGGRVIYDDAFAPLRLANPIRAMSRVIQTIGSDEAFVAKVGNATVIQTGTTNPWGYGVNNNTGSPNIATAFWQISMKSINAVVPVRTAVLSDVNKLEESIVADLMMEFGQQEALSMQQNSDASGSTTVQTGGVYGLRGLDGYTGSTSAAAFGTSGSADTNGRHTILQVLQASSSALAYNDIVNLATALPPQFWNNPTTAWMMHPTTLNQIRTLKDTSGLPLFLDVGVKDGAFIGYIFGHPVMPNPYMDLAGTGNFPVYLAAWDQFVTIADHEEMSIQRLEQYAPGFVTLFAEKRTVSTIRNPFAGVRLYA